MYLIISVFVLFFSIILFKRSAGTLSIKNLNMISWIFWFPLVTQSFIASILIVYYADKHYLIDKLVFPESRFLGWLAVQLCMFFFPLSMWLTTVFFKKRLSNKKQWAIFKSSELKPSTSVKDETIRTLLYFLSILCVSSVIYSFIVIRMFPFQGYFFNSDIGILRNTLSRNFQGIEYIKNILGVVLTPILSYVFYSYYRLYKDKRDLFLFICLFIASVCIVTFNYAKAPLVFYLLGFIFLKVIIGDQISNFRLCVYFGCAVIILIIFYMITGFDGSISELFRSYNTGILGRAFLSQAAGTYMAFDVYPQVYDHIGFDSLSKLFGHRERMAREIMEYFNHSGVEAGVAGVMNTLFIAEAWANWGWLGVVLSIVWVGFVIQFIYNSIIYGKKTPISLGIYAYLCYSLPVTGGFNDFIYNPSLFIIIFIFLLINLTTKLILRK